MKRAPAIATAALALGTLLAATPMASAQGLRELLGERANSRNDLRDLISNRVDDRDDGSPVLNRLRDRLGGGNN